MITPQKWMNKTDAFLNSAFGKAAKGHCLVLCPYSKCGNRRRVKKVEMGKHLVKNGFTPDYTGGSTMVKPIV